VVPWLFALARVAVAAPGQPIADPGITSLVADTRAALAAAPAPRAPPDPPAGAAAIYPPPSPRFRPPLPFPPPALAHRPLFWRASCLCFALGCARPESLGIYLWTHFPTVKNLMLMAIR
jgi:hypothetical protein